MGSNPSKSYEPPKIVEQLRKNGVKHMTNLKLNNITNHQLLQKRYLTNMDLVRQSPDIDSILGRIYDDGCAYIEDNNHMFYAQYIIPWSEARLIGKQVVYYYYPKNGRDAIGERYDELLEQQVLKMAHTLDTHNEHTTSEKEPSAPSEEGECSK